MRDQLVLPPAAERHLTAVRFQGLADVPPELEWFANISNKSTRRAYENALEEFMGFIGISQPGQFREAKRSHFIVWRDDLASRALSSDDPAPASRFVLALRVPV